MVVFSTICGSGHFNKPLESPKQRGTGRRSCEEVRLRRRRDNLCGYMASFFQFLILQISNILSGRQIKFPISYEETQNEVWKFPWEIYGNSISRNFHYISSATIPLGRDAAGWKNLFKQYFKKNLKWLKNKLQWARDKL